MCLVDRWNTDTQTNQTQTHRHIDRHSKKGTFLSIESCDPSCSELKTERERETETDRERKRQTERERNRETETERQRKRETEGEEEDRTDEGKPCESVSPSRAGCPSRTEIKTELDTNINWLGWPDCERAVLFLLFHFFCWGDVALRLMRSAASQ